MMGERTMSQESLFYGFNLERHVAADHLLRSIDRFVDLSDLREHLRPFYSKTGRPSIDPALMLRLLIIGYCTGIRSKRPLCEEVSVNLFAHLKRILKLERLRLRGLNGAKDEFLLAATAQNLRKLAKLRVRSGVRSVFVKTQKGLSTATELPHAAPKGVAGPAMPRGAGRCLADLNIRALALGHTGILQRERSNQNRFA